MHQGYHAVTAFVGVATVFGLFAGWTRAPWFAGLQRFLAALVARSPVLNRLCYGSRTTGR